MEFANDTTLLCTGNLKTNLRTLMLETKEEVCESLMENKAIIDAYKTELKVFGKIVIAQTKFIGNKAFPQKDTPGTFYFL